MEGGEIQGAGVNPSAFASPEAQGRPDTTTPVISLVPEGDSSQVPIRAPLQVEEVEQDKADWREDLTFQEKRVYGAYSQVVDRAKGLLPDKAEDDTPEQRRLREALEIDEYLREEEASYNPRTGDFTDRKGEPDNYGYYTKEIVDAVEDSGVAPEALAMLRPRLEVTQEGTEREGYRVDMREVRPVDLVSENCALLFGEMFRVSVVNNLDFATQSNLFAAFSSLSFGNLPPEAKIQLANEVFSSLSFEDRQLMTKIRNIKGKTRLPTGVEIPLISSFDDLVRDAGISYAEVSNYGKTSPLGEWLGRQLMLSGLPEETYNGLRPLLEKQIKAGNTLNLLLALEGAAFTQAQAEGNHVARFLGRLGIDISSGVINSDNPEIDQIINQVITGKTNVRALTHDIFGTSDGFTTDILQEIQKRTKIDLKDFIKNLGRSEKKQVNWQLIGVVAMIGSGVILPMMNEEEAQAA